jgi:pyruvate,water dikinase
MAFKEFFGKKKTCDFVANVTGELITKYNHFREFLEFNRDALTQLAELEQLYYGSRINLLAVRKQCDRLLLTVRKLVRALDGIGGGRYRNLLKACDRVEQELLPLFHSGPCCLIGDLVLPLEALRPETVTEAGSKATNLATIARFVKLPVPPGFAITSYAFERFMEEDKLAVPIEMILASLNPDDPEDFEAQSAIIQNSIRNAAVPRYLAERILQAYDVLESKTHPHVRIAMRSSAVGEDTEASFAGQHITVLNVTKDNILEAYKAVVASKYSSRAILYRQNFGLDDHDTPMCVAGITMIDSVASGVIYTVEPTRPDSGLLKVNSIWGLGEQLVSGEASPDAFFVDKSQGVITRRLIGRKREKLINLPGGGTQLVDVPEAENSQASLSDEQVLTLARYGMKLEAYFQNPQDIEWALDRQGQLFILQSRPLGLVQFKSETVPVDIDLDEYPLLLSQGQTASPGIAVGTVCPAAGLAPAHLPENPILVARTASPDYAALIGRLKGLITDIGSVTSHLASVAREFGVPTIVDAGNATAVLAAGQEITMVADQAKVYQGTVPGLSSQARPPRKAIFDSPVHHRLRTILDRISPLNLTDPKALNFRPSGCRTIHDIIRLSHEKAMREMFGLAEKGKSSANAIRLTANLPMLLYLIDLGGGLRSGLTICDTVTPDDLESLPMQALWRGFSHPGITWKGNINLDVKNFMALMAQGVMTGPDAMPGGDSYAILSRDYVNINAKFGYHFANLDAFDGNDPDQNYIHLQFAGGVGTFVGRSLRLTFLGEVLIRLGFSLKVTGDLLEASVSGLDQPSMDQTLDQVGRLLASSRLLDMAINSEADVQPMVNAFFQGDYDFLNQSESRRLPNFYTSSGNWRRQAEDGRSVLWQDGSHYLSSFSTGLASMMETVIGHTYLDILDNIGAYFYFPLAIAKESFMTAGVISVLAKPVAGSIDQAGGLAFAIRNVGNYFVFRINTLEDNVILFEFVNNKRLKRVTTPIKLTADRWYQLRVEFSGRHCRCFLDQELVIDYDTNRPLDGYIGLWTKADAVTQFTNLTIDSQGHRRTVEF